jgi:hypothetical protein
MGLFLDSSLADSFPKPIQESKVAEVGTETVVDASNLNTILLKEDQEELATYGHSHVRAYAVIV